MLGKWYKKAVQSDSSGAVAFRALVELPPALVASLRLRRQFAQVKNYCCFIGYPRSGHSLIGSLLSAHPDVVIAHELDALNYIRLRISRSLLFSLIVNRDRWFTRHGRQWTGYDYTVADAQQGQIRRLQVIGDKKGAYTSLRILRQPDLIQRLQATVKVPVRWLHIVRNPFDNISTMYLKAGPHNSLLQQINYYFQMCRGVQLVMDQVPPESILTMTQEEFTRDPSAGMTALCKHIQVEPLPSFVESCASIVFDSPRQTRHKAPWTDELWNDVYERCLQYAWLEPYRQIEQRRP